MWTRAPQSQAACGEGSRERELIQVGPGRRCGERGLGLPQTVMGAGIAAGPHCPFASGSAEAGLSQWAFSRAVTRTGSWPHVSGVRPRPKPRQVSPLAPRAGPKPWRFAARRIRNSRPSSLPWRRHGPKSVRPRPAGSSAEALVPPDMVMSRSPGSMPGSQLPGRNPVLPDPSEAEAPSEPVAVRLPEGTASCRAGPGSEDPVSGLAGPHPARRHDGSRMGAVRNLPP